MSKYHHGNLREELVRAAIEMIGREGVEGLSLRRVAKELGVSHAAPAHHFKSKADLLGEIVRSSYEDLTSHISAALEQAPQEDGTEQLRRMGTAAIGWAISHPVRFSVMNNPDVNRFADAGVKTALADFAGVVGDAITKAQGDGFHPGLSRETLLTFAVGATLGISTALTDGLIRSVIGLEIDPEEAGALAELIIPKNDR